MTAAVLTSSSRPRFTAEGALESAARFWFAVAVVGQGLFAFYIARFYGPSTLTGHFEAWRRNKSLIGGYVPGDTIGNLAFGAHVLLAAALTFAGALQLVPQIRARAPAVHRWIGRVFLATVMSATVLGFYMTFARQTAGPIGTTAISIEAVLIMAFAALAWRTALARNFASHRRWAMRAFIVANTSWFQRLGFVTYAIAAHGMGGTIDLRGPFFIFWAFGSYLVPLAVLELYFRAKTSAGPAPRFAMAGGLAAVTVLMGVGIAGVWFGMFAPALGRL